MGASVTAALLARTTVASGLREVRVTHPSIDTIQMTPVPEAELQRKNRIATPGTKT